MNSSAWLVGLHPAVNIELYCEYSQLLIPVYSRVPHVVSVCLSVCLCQSACLLAKKCSNRLATSNILGFFVSTHSS